MKWSERWKWFWFDLLEILVEEYWICPFCGSNKVAECWEVLEGKFRDGSYFGPYGGIDDSPLQYICDDCNDSWKKPWDCPYEYIYSWREWKHKGKMIKL